MICLCAKCYVICIVLDRIKSNKIKSKKYDCISSVEFRVNSTVTWKLYRQIGHTNQGGTVPYAVLFQPLLKETTYNFRIVTNRKSYDNKLVTGSASPETGAVNAVCPSE